jgi:hypothetical protein
MAARHGASQQRMQQVVRGHAMWVSSKGAGKSWVGGYFNHKSLICLPNVSKGKVVLHAHISKRVGTSRPELIGAKIWKKLHPVLLSL